MYLLSNEHDKPFAILAKADVRALKAIEEEFSVKEVEIEKLPHVDWGETKEFNFTAKDMDEEEEVAYTIQITKLVSY